jgi:hypothetical protein
LDGLDVKLNPEKVERAEREINSFINKRSEAKKRANAEAVADEARHKSRVREERRQNGRAWLEFHRSQWHSHCREASRHIDQYLQLKAQLGEE